MTENIVHEKTCGNCKNTKPSAQFPLRRANRDNLSGWCRVCWAVYRAHRHARKGKRIREYQRAYVELHRSAGMCSLCKTEAVPKRTLCARHLADKSSLSHTARFKRLLARKCYICGDNRTDSELVHPSQNQCRRHYVQQMASVNMGDHRMWEQLLGVLEAQKYRCAYTGEPLVLGVNASVDHIKPRAKFPELRADIGNIQWVLTSVNFMKRALTHEDFLDLTSKIYRHSISP